MTGVLNLDEIRERHASYGARVGADGQTVNYCKKCGLPWPCDAMRLVALVTNEANQPFARWRGLCGHEWYADPDRTSDDIPACPICDAGALVQRLVEAIRRANESARPR